MRPVENGLSIVVDPLGRIVASQADTGEHGNVFAAELPLNRMQALYPWVGDGFAYLNLIGLAVLLIRAGVRGRSEP